MKTHQNTLEALERKLAERSAHAHPLNEQPLMLVNAQVLADLVADVRVMSSNLAAMRAAEMSVLRISHPHIAVWIDRMAEADPAILGPEHDDARRMYVYSWKQIDAMAAEGDS